MAAGRPVGRAKTRDQARPKGTVFVAAESSKSLENTVFLAIKRFFWSFENGIISLGKMLRKGTIYDRTRGSHQGA
jgi:esterase/lipase superfamily enzyme